MSYLKKIRLKWAWVVTNWNKMKGAAAAAEQAAGSREGPGPGLRLAHGCLHMGAWNGVLIP